MCAAPRTAKRPSEFVIDRSQLVSRGGGRIVHGDGQLVVPFSTIISIRKEASKSIEQGMHEKSLASFISHELSLMQLCDDECSETPDKLSLRLCIDSFFPHEAKNDFNMDSVHRLRFQKTTLTIFNCYEIKVAKFLNMKPIIPTMLKKRSNKAINQIRPSTSKTPSNKIHYSLQNLGTFCAWQRGSIASPFPF